MLQIPKKLEDFSFSVSGKDFGRVLKVCDEVVKFSDADKMVEDLHLIVCDGKAVYAIGRTIDTFICHRLPAEDVSGVGAASVDFKSFATLVKRDSVHLAFRRGGFSAKASRFEFDQSTKQVSLDQLEMIDVTLRSVKTRSDGDALSRKAVSMLRDAVALTYVPDIYLGAQVTSHIEVANGRLRVSTARNWCVSIYESAIQDTDDFKLSLHSDMITLLYKVVGDLPAQFYVSGSHFIASSDDFMVTLPPVRSTDADYNTFATVVAALGAPVRSCFLGKDFGPATSTIMQVIASNPALKGKAVPFELTVGEKAAKLQFDTDGCRMAETVGAKATERFNVKLDVRILNLILKNVMQLDKETQHRCSMYGAVGKYKAARFDYKKAGATLSFMMYANL